MLRFVRSAASSSSAGLSSRLAPPRLAFLSASPLSESPAPRSSAFFFASARPYSASVQRWAASAQTAAEAASLQAPEATASATTPSQAAAATTTLATILKHEPADQPQHAAITPTSAPGDPRAYRVITLGNGMRCALVSDPFSERAAASLDVKVGCFHDPTSLPGLATLCPSVMLSSSSVLSTTADSFESFVSASNATATKTSTQSSRLGSSSAYTDDEHSRLSFDVEHARLAEALERFVEIIQTPSFTQQAIDRGVHALDKAYQCGFQPDQRSECPPQYCSYQIMDLERERWRTLQMLRATANPQHPFSRFAEGNQATLRDKPKAVGLNVREELINFHRAHYTADRMSLAVSGRESLEQLEQMVRAAFESIPTVTAEGRAANTLAIDTHAFTPAQLGRFVQIVPRQKKTRQLQFLWHFDSDASQCLPYAKKSLEFLASLLAYTEANTDDFRTGGGRSEESAWIDGQPHADVLFTTHFSLLTFTLALTEKGMDHTQELAERVMSFIKHQLPEVLEKLSEADDVEYRKRQRRRSGYSESQNVKLEGVDLWRLEERQKVAALKQAEEKAKAGRCSTDILAEISQASLPLVRRLSHALHMFPPERVVTESTEGLDRSATVKHFVALLNDPSRMHVHSTSLRVYDRAVEAGAQLATERWSGLMFLDEPMPSSMIRYITQPRRVDGLQLQPSRASSWRSLLHECLALHGESWSDVQHCTLDDAGLDKKFSLGCSAWAEPFTLWTATRVYMEHEQDGAYSVTSRERHPICTASAAPPPPA